MKKKVKKLVLAKETVRSLTDTELRKAEGGVSGCTCNTAARHCISGLASCED
jgi:hypothetical protein